MNKKFFTTAICLTLCVVMSVAFLSACGKKKQTNGPTPSSDTNGTSSIIFTGDGDYSVPESTTENSSSKSDKTSSKTNKGSSKVTTTNGSSSSKNEQSGIIPDDWELGDESSSSSKAQSTSSNKVSSKAQIIVSGNGGDILTGWPDGFQ